MHVKGVTNINITRVMVLAARSARSKYTHITRLRRRSNRKKRNDKKRKAETDAVRELEDKRKHLKTDISSLLPRSVKTLEI